MKNWFSDFWVYVFGNKPETVPVQETEHVSVPEVEIVPTINISGGYKNMKKALLVSSNYVGTSSQLNGCVNDTLLENQLIRECWPGIENMNIRMLTDKSATTANIIDRLKWLVEGAMPKDVLLFCWSGHGVQMACPNYELHQEADGLDECICLAGDTKIPLLDGTEDTIANLALSGKEFHTYSIDKEGNVHAGKVLKVWKTSDNAEVVRVTLDNGEYVRCTPEHLWMKRDGSYFKAKDLKAGDSMMPLYRSEYKYGSKPYERVYNPATQENVPTHRFAAGECPKSILEKAVEQKCGVVVHHKDFNAKNNGPVNLEWMTWFDHNKFHTQSKEQRDASAEMMNKRWSNPEYKREFSLRQVKWALKRWENPEYRKKISDATCKQDLTDFRAGYIKYCTNLTAEERFARGVKAGSAKKNKTKGYVSRMKKRWLDPVYRAFMIDKQSKSMKSRWEDPEKRKLLNNGAVGVLNHKIVSVVPDGFDAVYDISVPEYENFAVSAGVFIHNCPDNFDWRENVIRDEDFKRIFANVPTGVNLTVISDSCHSGSLLRDMVDPSIQPSASPNRPRTMCVPPDISNRSYGMNLNVKAREIRNEGGEQIGILISGCRSDQTSADAWVQKAGKYHGALTYYLSEVLKDANYDISYEDLVKQVNVRLSEAGYEQEPQLDCKDEYRKIKFLSPIV